MMLTRTIQITIAAKWGHAAASADRNRNQIMQWVPGGSIDYSVDNYLST